MRKLPAIIPVLVVLLLFAIVLRPSSGPASGRSLDEAASPAAESATPDEGVLGPEPTPVVDLINRVDDVVDTEMSLRVYRVTMQPGTVLPGGRNYHDNTATVIEVESGVLTLEITSAAGQVQLSQSTGVEIRSSDGTVVCSDTPCAPMSPADVRLGPGNSASLDQTGRYELRNDGETDVVFRISVVSPPYLGPDGTATEEPCPCYQWPP